MNNHHLSPKQQQKLIEIGSNLRNIRLSKSISLDSVAENTLISKRLLEAIEAGDLAELPEPFYIQALISKFAREIGAENIELAITPMAESELAQSAVGLKNSRKYWFNFQLRSLHLYLIYILLVVISVKGITVLVERPIVINETAPLEKTTEAEVTEAKNPPETVLSQPAPQFVSQSSTPESVTVGIDLQERCWLKVMVDGKVAFEGTLPKGTKRNWSGKEQVTIRAGNAGGVVISFNNEQQKVLGAPGQVEEITYTVN
ncbi:MAG: RodZ domain-containing protein [Cyanobacteria bacterium P01_G01_bin.19]